MKTISFLLLLIFISACSKDFVRYHGHKYHVVKTGSQQWMDENLATNRYRNGKNIPEVSDYSVWPELTSPALGYYNNDTALLRKYGMFYNWYAVESGKLCPRGWRVPTNRDWDILEKELGGFRFAGGKMKAVNGWWGNHVSGDDVGFKAYPSGYRLNGDFNEGKVLVWWSSSIPGRADFQNDSLYNAYKDFLQGSGFYWGRKMEFNSTQLMTTLNRPNNGFSVRCVKVKP
jgi:uncharacterized protein (TIGR02145 family)